MPHIERHDFDRIGWLRDAVLGANYGIISTASLVVGVAASDATRGEIMIAGVAGLVAGAMSMAAGEFVSVSSQAGTESADMAREKQELATDPEHELAELTGVPARVIAAGCARAGTFMYHPHMDHVRLVECAGVLATVKPNVSAHPLRVRLSSARSVVLRDRSIAQHADQCRSAHHS